MGINILALNDLHLNHPHIPASDTHDNLKRLLYPLLVQGNIDMLSIGGDFFDSALYLDDVGSLHAMEIMTELCQLAKQHDFAIRVIRGTYTHDRDQLAQMIPIARKHGIDFAYYTGIAVDVYKGFSFLYLPDNLPLTVEAIMANIKELLKPFDGKVDCVFGHGYFDYVLPPIAAQPGHFITHYKVKTFERFVNEVVVMGHVHQFSNCRIVWYSGSFDCNCHGEEETKGFLRIHLEHGNTKVNLIPNQFSMPHISLQLCGNTVEDQFSDINKKIRKVFPVPLRGYLRVIGGETLKTVTAMLREKYKGQLTITELDINLKNKSSTKTRLDFGFKQHQSEVPTRENLAALVHEYLNNNVMNFDLSQIEIESGLQELQTGSN